MNNELAIYPLTPSDYPFTEWEINYYLDQIPIVQIVMKYSTYPRFVFWALFFFFIGTVARKVPKDAESTNVVANTKEIIRIAWIPFVVELFCLAAMYISIEIQKNVDQDKDQIRDQGPIPFLFWKWNRK